MRAITPLLVCSLALGAASLRASGPTSPVGYLVQLFPTATDAPVTTYLGAPLSEASTFAGKVASASADTLMADNAPGWTDGQFTGASFFVRITSGEQAGRTLAVMSNTTDSLVLDTTDGSAESTPLDTDGFALAAGDTFEIVPCRTLGSLLPDNLADSVGLWSLQLGAFENYAFDAQAGHWVKAGVSSTDDYTNLPILPNTAIAVVRQAGRAAAMSVFTGFPAAVAPLVKLAGNGATQYVGFPLPVDTLLVNLGLENWQRKNSFEKADVLSLYKASKGKWKEYYERKDNFWLQSNGAIKNSVVIPAGSVVGLLKRKAVSGEASFLRIGLPYTL